MTRTDVINYFISKYGYKSYLEIGVDDRSLNFNKIKCENKYCVDPNEKAKADFVGTSDDFFKNNQRKFDLIFIDGLHVSEQVKRDADNSLSALNEGGTIVFHDCNPTSLEMQVVPRQQGVWTGDTWKAFVSFRNRPDLEIFTIDTDYGCGVIRRGSQQPVIIDRPTYEQFEIHKKKWLNLISVKELLTKISIVIPTYSQRGHGGKMFTQLLNTIWRQNIDCTYEVVVSDNATDGSIKQVCDRFYMLPINYVESKRVGVSDNTNNAIDNAKYDFIKPMYMDDLFAQNNSINVFADALHKNKWVISNSVHINENGEITKQKKTAYKHGYLDYNTVGMPSVIGFNRCNLRFDNRLKTYLDMYFYYQLYELYGPPGVIKEFTIAQRFWKGSLSANQKSYLRADVDFMRKNKMIAC